MRDYISMKGLTRVRDGSYSLAIVLFSDDYSATDYDGYTEVVTTRSDGRVERFNVKETAAEIRESITQYPDTLALGPDCMVSRILSGTVFPTL